MAAVSWPRAKEPMAKVLWVGSRWPFQPSGLLRPVCPRMTLFRWKAAGETVSDLACNGELGSGVCEHWKACQVVASMQKFCQPAAQYSRELNASELNLS